MLFRSGRDGNGAEVELETVVSVNGVLTCDQSGPLCMPPGKSLPATFLGTVRMQAVNPIAVVVQRLSADGSLADYRGCTGVEASTQVVLPPVRAYREPLTAMLPRTPQNWISMRTPLSVGAEWRRTTGSREIGRAHV